MNTPVEVDMYCHANSSLIGGTKIINGLGGSGDFLRNAYLSIMHTPSTRPTKSDPTGVSCIGAKIGRPDKVCINIAGDGCFRMNMNELATASRYNIPIIQVVINNAVLGRMLMDIISRLLLSMILQCGSRLPKALILTALSVFMRVADTFPKGCSGRILTAG